MAYDSGRQQTINTDSQAAKNLGYSGSTNAEFDEWYKGLDSLQLEYMRTENPVLLQYIQALNSTNDPYTRQQLEGAYANFKSQSFNPNLGQWFGELFGDTSARANFNNQLNSGFSESIKNILEGRHTEVYTDPAAETTRRRAAGLNDDLSGGSQIGSGDPAKIDESQLAPGVLNSGLDPMSTIGSAMQGVMNIFQSTMSFVSQLKQFELQNLSMASNELNNLTSADSWLKDMLGKHIRYDFDSEEKLAGRSDTYSGAFSKAVQEALEYITGTPEFNSLSPRTRKAVKTISSNYQLDNVSTKALYEKLKNDYLSNRQKNVEIQSSYTFSSFLNQWISNSEPYMKSFYESQMKHFEAMMKEPDKVQSEINSANASARSANASATMTEYRKQKVETIGTLFDNIKSAIPNDAWYKGMAEWFTEMSRIMTIQALIKE